MKNTIAKEKVLQNTISTIEEAGCIWVKTENKGVYIMVPLNSILLKNNRKLLYKIRDLLHGIGYRLFMMRCNYKNN